MIVWIIIVAFYLISNTHSWMNVFFIMNFDSICVTLHGNCHIV